MTAVQLWDSLPWKVMMVISWKIFELRKIHSNYGHHGYGYLWVYIVISLIPVGEEHQQQEWHHKHSLRVIFLKVSGLSVWKQILLIRFLFFNSHKYTWIRKPTPNVTSDDIKWGQQGEQHEMNQLEIIMGDRGVSLVVRILYAQKWRNS